MMPTKPFVVMDLNVLHGRPADLPLPTGFTVLITDMMTREIRRRPDHDMWFAKFRRVLLLKENRGRIIVGRYWNELARREATPDHIATGCSAIVHQDLTRVLLGEQGSPSAWPPVDGTVKRDPAER